MREESKELKGFVMNDEVLVCDSDSLCVDDKETGKSIELEKVNVLISNDYLMELVEDYMVTSEIGEIRGFVTDNAILVSDSDEMYVKDKETGKNIKLEKVNVTIDDSYIGYLMEELDMFVI